MRRKLCSIPNIVEPTILKSNPALASNGRFRILAVGRICDQKNYPSLIKAFSRLAPLYENWDLEIIGEGSFENYIKNEIEKLELSHRVILTKATKEIHEKYQKANIFCMPSKWEGFPNALAEALAHGLPAVGFSECDGVKDLIVNGVNGLLAEGMGDDKTLEKSLSALMNDGQLRSKLGRNASESISQYHPDHVYSLWQRFFEAFPE